jgi:hypothetical protein
VIIEWVCSVCRIVKGGRNPYIGGYKTNGQDKITLLAKHPKASTIRSLVSDIMSNLEGTTRREKQKKKQVSGAPPAGVELFASILTHFDTRKTAQAAFTYAMADRFQRVPDQQPPDEEHEGSQESDEKEEYDTNGNDEEDTDDGERHYEPQLGPPPEEAAKEAVKKLVDSFGRPSQSMADEWDELNPSSSSSSSSSSSLPTSSNNNTKILKQSKCSREKLLWDYRVLHRQFFKKTFFSGWSGTLVGKEVLNMFETLAEKLGGRGPLTVLAVGSGMGTLSVLFRAIKARYIGLEVRQVYGWTRR